MKSMIIGTIVRLERLNNSVYGNPRYNVVIRDESGDYYFYAKTASDASCGYVIDEYLDKKKLFHYHVTRKGNNIIDCIDPIM